MADCDRVTDPQDLIKDEFTADRIRRLQFLTYDHLDINPLHRVDSNCARACAGTIVVVVIVAVVVVEIVLMALLCRAIEDQPVQSTSR